MEEKLNNYQKFQVNNSKTKYNNEEQHPSKINEDEFHTNSIFQNELIGKNKFEEKINFDKINSNEINTMLSDKEILKSKENGFILIGKTGVGKTSLLNIIFGKTIGKVGYTSKSETKLSNYYCIKENIQGEIVYFCIVDTPGLYDCDGLDADKEQKVEIIKLFVK